MSPARFRFWRAWLLIGLTIQALTGYAVAFGYGTLSMFA
jgi:hypothetical protein